MLVNTQLTVSTDFHSREKKKNYGSQWGPTTGLLPTFFKYILLCSAEERNSYRFGTN